MTELKRCPFCGLGETIVDEKRLPPTMKGQGALISAEVKHWCSLPKRSYMRFTGRERQDAIDMWNQQSLEAKCARYVEALSRIANSSTNDFSDPSVDMAELAQKALEKDV